MTTRGQVLVPDPDHMFRGGIPKVWWRQEDSAECVCGHAEDQRGDARICGVYATSMVLCRYCVSVLASLRAEYRHAEQRPSACKECGHCLICHVRMGPPAGSTEARVITDAAHWGAPGGDGEQYTVDPVTGEIKEV